MRRESSQGLVAPFFEEEIEHGGRGILRGRAILRGAEEEVQLLPVSIQRGLVVGPLVEEIRRDGFVGAGWVLFCPSDALAGPVLFVEPPGNRLRFAGVARATQNRFVGREAISANDEAEQAGTSWGRRENDETGAAVATGLWVIPMDDRGIGDAFVIGHLRGAKLDLVLGSLGIAAGRGTEEPGIPLGVNVLPRAGASFVNQIGE